MLLGLIEVCKWRRNIKKVKNYVEDTNYYYNKDKDEDYNFDDAVTDKNDYYESIDKKTNDSLLAF